MFSYNQKQIFSVHANGSQFWLFMKMGNGHLITVKGLSVTDVKINKEEVLEVLGNEKGSEQLALFNLKEKKHTVHLILSGSAFK